MGEKAIRPAFGDPLFEEQLARYHFTLSLAKERNALDVGCGTGFGSCALATVAYQVTAVDSDISSLEFARKTYQHPRIDFVNDDLTQLKGVKKKFDVVTAFEVLEVVNDRETFLRHLAAHVHPTGVALFSVNRAVLSAQEFKSLALRHFGEVQMYGQIKSRGAFGDLLFRMGLVGELKTPMKADFSFQPLMYWRPEVGWGESGRFRFSPSLWKRAEHLVAVGRKPKFA